MYMIFPLCMDAVQMRFTLGLSFLIFGMRYLSDEYVDKYKNYKISADIRFIICIIIASMFHSINILYLLLLVAKKVKRKNIIIIMIAFIVIFSTILSPNVLIQIGSNIGVGKKITSALQINANRHGHAILRYSFSMILRFSLFFIVSFISKYSLKRKSNGVISSDFAMNTNIIVLNIMGLMQYSVEFYRIQVGLSLFNYCYLSNYLIDFKSKKGTVWNKKNSAIVMLTVIMAIIDLYNLVLNNANFEAVFIPFFFWNLLIGGGLDTKPYEGKAESTGVIIEVALC